MHEQKSMPEGAEPNRYIVSVERVSKRFGGINALRSVTLRIGRGEVYGLLGPNGAGKSTLLKLLMGFLYPDKGEIKLFGSTNLTRAHARLGYLPERARYHGNFSGRDYLRFHGRLSGFSATDAARIADHVLEAVGLQSSAKQRINTYSKGMTQRLGLAVVLAGAGGEPPDLMVLDEPASGLDPEGQVAIRDLILGYRERGSTILLCSHQLTEVEKICSTVGILRSGRLVTQMSLHGGSRAYLTATPREGALAIAPALIAYLTRLHPEVVVQGGTENEPLVVSLPAGAEVPNSAAIKAAAIRAVVDGRWDIASFHVESKDLEALYMRAVQSPSQRNGKADHVPPSRPAPRPPPGPSGELEQELPTSATTGKPTTPLKSLES